VRALHTRDLRVYNCAAIRTRERMHRIFEVQCKLLATLMRDDLNFTTAITQARKQLGAGAFATFVRGGIINLLELPSNCWFLFPEHKTPGIDKQQFFD
jgi:hypothetical protein